MAPHQRWVPRCSDMRLRTACRSADTPAARLGLHAGRRRVLCISGGAGAWGIHMCRHRCAQSSSVKSVGQAGAERGPGVVDGQKQCAGPRPLCTAALLRTSWVPWHPAVAGPEADLDVFGDEAQLYVLPANETLTFEHTYTWWGESAQPRSASRTRRSCAVPRRLTPHLQPPAVRLLGTSTACPRCRGCPSACRRPLAAATGDCQPQHHRIAGTRALALPLGACGPAGAADTPRRGRSQLCSPHR